MTAVKRRPHARFALTGETVMGILSWFRSLRSTDVSDEPYSLIRPRPEDPDFEPTEEAAAADVAAVEQDDKYFRANSPSDQDEL